MSTLSRLPRVPKRTASTCFFPKLEILEVRALPSFIAPGSYNVGLNPLGLVTADFNRDGHPDLVSVNFRSNSVSVLLGNGNGTFQPAVNYGVGFSPDFVTAADVSGDGIPDLLVANRGTSDISVLLGKGDGTFRPKMNYMVGAQPYAIAVVDINGDGKPDLVVINNVDSSVSVLLGNGNGTFAAGQTVSLESESHPDDVATGDWNHDGKVDLAVSFSGGGTGVFILLGNGNGTFGAPVKISAGSMATAVVAADFNGDGKLDLALTSQSGFPLIPLTVLLGNGDGTFQPPVNYAGFGVGNGLTVIDVNGDSKPDIAVASGRAVSVYLGNGDGTFQAPAITSFGRDVDGVVAADFNGDAKVDLAVADQYTFGVDVLLNQGNGTIFQAPSYVGNTQTAVATGDFNGDGKLDVITAGGFGVSLFQGNGDGTFQQAVNVNIGTYTAGIVVGDFNGDGKLDVAVGTGNFFTSANTVSVLLGNGNGTFKSPINTTLGTDPEMLATGDFNGDGKLDLAVSINGSNVVSVLLGKGNGKFQAPVNYTVGSGPAGVAVADLNGDGRQDLVVVNYSSNSVSVLLGNGNGTFQNAVNYAVGQGTSGLVVGDFNGDGKLDLALSGAGNLPFVVSVLLGNGDGTFQNPVNSVSGLSTTTLAIGDFNGDGKPDLAVADFYGSAVTVLLGNGDGTFGPPASYSVPYGPRSVAVGDFNGDGAPDLAVADGALNILVNRPDATHLGVTAPARVKAGQAFSVTVQALSNFGTVDPLFLGTLHFSSTDAKAKLPVDYAFTDADQGVHTFTTGVTFKTAARQTLTVTDVGTASISGKVRVVVKPGKATHLSVSAPSSVTAGTAFSVLVTALDAYGNVAAGYKGTVHFQATDPSPVLPPDYPFTAADEGQHTFSVTLNGSGSETLTVTDTAKASITGFAVVTVNPGGNAPNGWWVPLGDDDPLGVMDDYFAKHHRGG